MGDTPDPPEYTDGLGELVQAHRLYTGMTTDGFARRLNMREASLTDIETGRRSCPPGLFDTIREVLTDFDREVDATVDRADTMVKAEAEGEGLTTWEGRAVTIDVTRMTEWQRVILGRAAVHSGTIMPTIVCTHVRRPGRFDARDDRHAAKA